MNDFNPNAEKHPCMKCEYGNVWTEQGKPSGNYCIHPDITCQKGLFYGRFHSLKLVPKWCPKKEQEK